jgi:hypothetical protein
MSAQNDLQRTCRAADVPDMGMDVHLSTEAIEEREHIGKGRDGDRDAFGKTVRAATAPSDPENSFVCLSLANG